MCRSPYQVNSYRGRVKWIIRAVATALTVTGAYLCLKRILFAIGSGDLQVPFRVWGDDFGESNSFYRGAAMLLVGSALAITSEWVSRWIITVPPDECPRCGHARSPGQGGDRRCPECGLQGVNDSGRPGDERL